jgi:hypothetical protein
MQNRRRQAGPGTLIAVERHHSDPKPSNRNTAFATLDGRWGQSQRKGLDAIGFDLRRHKLRRERPILPQPGLTDALFEEIQRDAYGAALFIAHGPMYQFSPLRRAVTMNCPITKLSC